LQTCCNSQPWKPDCFITIYQTCHRY
jgi:hypothetical protein